MLHTRIKKVFVTLIVLTLLTSTLEAEQEIDKETGLIVSEGLEQVKENCSVCHPGNFMVMNGGDKKFWTGKMRLMQRGFGLWDLDKETEESILNYLTNNYPKKVQKEEE